MNTGLPGPSVAGRAAVGPAGAPRASRTVLAGFAWAGLSLLIFSGWFVVTRFSMTRTLGVWDITALRFGVGAVLLSPVLFRPGVRLPPGAWREGFLFAILWGAPFVLLVAGGLRLTSAAQAASVAPTLMPVFAGLFAFLFLGQAPGRLRWLGYAAIVAGLAGLVLSGGHAPDPVGIGALALAAAMWGGYTLLFRRSRLTPLQSAALICTWSALLVLPAYLLLGLCRLGQAPAGEIAVQALYQGALMSGVAVVTFNRAVALLGPVAAAAVIALLPGVATLLAIPVLGEVPTPAGAAAAAAIAAGVLLAARPAPILLAARRTPRWPGRGAEDAATRHGAP